MQSQPQYPGEPYGQVNSPRQGWQEFPFDDHRYRGVLLPRYVEYIADAGTTKQLNRVLARRLALSPVFWGFTLAYPLTLIGWGIIQKLWGSDETDWSIIAGAYLGLLVPCLLGFSIGCCLLAIKGSVTTRTIGSPEAQSSVRYGYTSMDVRTPAAWNTVEYSDVRGVEVFRHAAYIRIRKGGLLIPRQLMPDDVLPLFNPVRRR